MRLFFNLIVLTTLVSLTRAEVVLVLCHGLFGWGEDDMLFDYWGFQYDGFRAPFGADEDTIGNDVKIFQASVGPISSSYDRARELFYQIKGGTVDYGADHGTRFGHARFGKTYEGFYPEWDGSHPINLMGHSLGGPTIRMMYDMLANGGFEGHDTDSSWVFSIATVTGVNNGATLLGDSKSENFNDSELSWLPVNLFTPLLQVLGLSAITLDDTFYPLHLEHWGYKQDSDESILSYILSIFEKEDNNMFADIDNGASSCTLANLFNFNARAVDRISATTPPQSTFFFAFYDDETWYNIFTGHEVPLPTMFLPLQPLGYMEGIFRFDENGICPECNQQLGEWRVNDALVPRIAQKHPLTAECRASPHSANCAEGVENKFASINANTPSDTLVPGVWYEQEFDPDGSWDHLDVIFSAIDRPFHDGRYRTDFYVKHIQRIRELQTRFGVNGSGAAGLTVRSADAVSSNNRDVVELGPALGPSSPEVARRAADVPADPYLAPTKTGRKHASDTGVSTATIAGIGAVVGIVSIAGVIGGVLVFRHRRQPVDTNLKPGIV
eukprot:Clim_evm8s142 gene=Clim_evmTU8s142